MNLVVFFLRNMDNKSSVDLRVFSLLYPQAFNRYLKRNIDNQSSICLHAFLDIS